MHFLTYKSLTASVATVAYKRDTDFIQAPGSHSVARTRQKSDSDMIALLSIQSDTMK